VVNGVFIKLMETMKNLAQVSGNTSDVSYYQGLQDAVKSRFDPYFWNSRANAYVFYNQNNKQSQTIDDRSNAWAVLAECLSILNPFQTSVSDFNVSSLSTPL
jgi:hypothetical protein